MQASLERLRARREQRGGEGGFTLIELLIVIVILGILAAIVVFAVQNLTGQSASAGCQSDYKTVETAAEAYKAQMGTYPTTITSLTSTATQPGSGQTVGPWLKDVPTTTHYTLTINTTKVFSDANLNTTFPSLAADGVIYVSTGAFATGNGPAPVASTSYGTTGFPSVSPAPPTVASGSGSSASPYVYTYPANNAQIACKNVTSA